LAYVHTIKEFRTMVVYVKNIQIFKYTNKLKKIVDKTNEKVKMYFLVNVNTDTEFESLDL